MPEFFPNMLSRAGVWAAVLLAVAVGCKKEPAQPAGGAPGAGAHAAAAEPVTPKETALAFSRALSAGDAAAAKALSTGDVPPQTFETLSTLAAATGRLQRALKDKFGAKAADLAIFTESPDPADELTRSTETITGDDAVIRLSPTDKNPTTLKKVGGRWKVDVTKFKDAEPMFPQLGKMAAAWNDLAADVAAGKFATVDDFKKAFDARVQAAAKG